jgi:hypothetical protein
MANTKRNRYTAGMDEGRKRVLLIAASILAARKLAQYDGGARVSPSRIAGMSNPLHHTGLIVCRKLATTSV